AVGWLATPHESTNPPLPRLCVCLISPSGESVSTGRPSGATPVKVIAIDRDFLASGPCASWVGNVAKRSQLCGVTSIARQNGGLIGEYIARLSGALKRNRIPRLIDHLILTLERKRGSERGVRSASSVTHVIRRGNGHSASESTSNGRAALICLWIEDKLSGLPIVFQ